VLDHGADDNRSIYGAVLVEQLLEETARDGADLALFFQAAGPTSPVPDGFAVVPTTDVELTVTESSRYGAPMALVRAAKTGIFKPSPQPHASRSGSLGCP
jgi:hypothetical protein